MENFKTKFFSLLKKDARLWNEETEEINETLLKDLIDKLDEKLVELLLNNKETKEKFFIKVKDVYVLKQNEVKFFIDENKLDNSYTQYQNKIGLRVGNKLLSERNEVVLDWPFKDCVLEGGMTKEDQKRNEIFFNEVLAKDEIDRLKDPKALINWKRYTSKGEEKVKELKRDEDGTIKENLIIKGNNLLALHSLKEQFTGKVKLIYIDPPYNKDADTFYNDNFRHSTWLTFMRNRLKVAKQLLRDDGFIFVQCDDNEQAYLKVLMDEVFDYNFVNNVVVKMSETSGVKMSHVTKKLPKVKEYILVYNRSSKALLNPIRIKKTEEANKLENYLKYYQNIITNPKDDVENWKVVSLKSYLEKNKLPIDKKSIIDFQIKNAENIVYRTNNKSFAKLKIDKKITKVISSTGLEYIWWEGKQMLFLNDYIDEYICDLWTDISTINLNKEGGVDLENGKKPEKLIERIIKMVTDEGNLILDYHLGSGTTCAVAHKMNRQYIGVEQLDYGENDSVIRLKNVIGGDQSGISKSVNWKSGGDFVYLELAEWNEEAKGKIKKSKSLNELEKLFDELYERYFLNYNVKTKEFKEKILKEEGFKKLSLDKQKKLFVEMLDMNQMYINFSERADKKYNLSKDDIALSEDFYNEKK